MTLLYFGLSKSIALYKSIFSSIDIPDSLYTSGVSSSKDTIFREDIIELRNIFITFLSYFNINFFDIKIGIFHLLSKVNKSPIISLKFI